MTNQQKHELKTAEFTIPDSTETDTKHGRDASSYRLTADNRSRLPLAPDTTALRQQLAQLFHERFDESYGKLEQRCDIKRDTFQKMLRFKNGKRITYLQLSKFAIGAQLSPKEAIYLFQQIDHTLSYDCRKDAILLFELENHGTIDEYNDDLLEFGYESILSKAD